MSLKPPLAPTDGVPSILETIDGRLDDLEGGGGVEIRVAAPTGVAATDRANILSAIQEADALGSDASNTSGNAVVKLQHGHYKVGSGFDLTGLYKVTIAGTGIMSTFLELTGTGHLFYGAATSGSTDGRGCIRDLGMLGNASSGNGINFEYMNPEWLFERLYIREFTDGVKFLSCYENELRHVRCHSNRGWGFNFHRQNDSTTLINCYAASNTTGGFRLADGFMGPVVGGKTQSNPIGMLIENTADAGVTTGHALMHAINIRGMVIEGDANQTQGLKITSAVATKVAGISLDMEFLSGAGTLLEADGCDGLHGFIHTKGSGSPATSKHIDLKSNCQNAMIFHTWQQGASETTWADAGSGNLRLDKDGLSAIKTYANAGVYLAKGDTQPQVSVARNGSTGGKIAFGIGSSTATDCEFGRTGGNKIGATNADLQVVTVGKGLEVKEGSNAKMGTATLSSGSVVVSTTAVATGDRIFITAVNTGGTAGFLSYTISNNTSFTVTSTQATDARTFNWLIVRPTA